MGINVKKIGESIANAFGEEVFFLQRVDIEKIGKALGCKPILVELVNTILNQNRCEYIYSMVRGKKFITTDESNMAGCYTPIPRTMEQLCVTCKEIIDKALLSPTPSLNTLVDLVAAKIMLDGYINKAEFIMDFHHSDGSLNIQTG